MGRKHMSAIVFWICCSGLLIEAMIVTRYERVLSPVTSEFIPCAISAATTDHCAARVTHNNTCEPLTRDWCEIRDTSVQGSYFIKTMIIHILEETYLRSYIQPMPIVFSDGSGVETKFKLHVGNYRFRVFLEDMTGNAILRASCELEFFEATWFDVGSLPQNIQISNFTISSGVKYTLRIVRVNNAFQIYLDGAYILTYTSGLPIDSITHIKIKFRGGGVDGYLYEVAHRVGG